MHTNYLAVKKLISSYEEKYGREKNSVRLLLVSKGQAIEKINALYAEGHQSFGENYLQEALAKMMALHDKNIEWHFIGQIQSNKTKKIAEHFSWVQSVSTQKIAKRLNDQRPSHLPPLNICIEVNVSHESTKSGITEESLLGFATYCQTLPRLKLRGLMAIPAPQHDLSHERITFRKLFSLFQSLNKQGFDLDTLSMGMSDDFEAAIAEGSNMVRLGRVVFGARAK